MHLHTHTHPPTYTRIHTQTHIYIYSKYYKYIYIHIYTHIYLYTIYIYMKTWDLLWYSTTPLLLGSDRLITNPNRYLTVVFVWIVMREFSSVCAMVVYLFTRAFLVPSVQPLVMCNAMFCIICSFVMFVCGCNRWPYSGGILLYWSCHGLYVKNNLSKRWLSWYLDASTAVLSMCLL